MTIKSVFSAGMFRFNKPLIVLLMILIVCAFTIKSKTVERADPGKQTVLELPKGSNNPRNSEGDFITLKNGNILFIYSHFTGKSGSDFGHGYLASRYSEDSGKTWSKE